MEKQVKALLHRWHDTHWTILTSCEVAITDPEKSLRHLLSRVPATKDFVVTGESVSPAGKAAALLNSDTMLVHHTKHARQLLEEVQETLGTAMQASIIAVERVQMLLDAPEESFGDSVDMWPESGDFRLSASASSTPVGDFSLSINGCAALLGTEGRSECAMLLISCMANPDSCLDKWEATMSPHV
ncbi:hypothetical protein CYMTET_46135 [Cymbomonas tetramitiformis]|uniref:Uncharacterized protein n=1 Tax=Cymbomonas tetramitiformis TaxID=36881 RepID=A0AAE0BYK7_9CHLO|nr:hypothetical protein CYMTET_46135 [Cymbomonas tetramitiformis]